MAKRSDRLQLVVQLAERELESFAQKLAKINQQVTFEQQRLDELQSYFTEYQNLAREQGGAGISVVRLMNFNHFMNSLRAAIEQQGKTIEYLHNQQVTARQQWLNAQAKAKNLQNFVVQAQQQESILEEKKLQKELDDSYSAYKRH